MARPKATFTFRAPERFSSLDDLHRQGFALESEKENCALEQPWTAVAKIRRISLAELGRKTGLARQYLSSFSAGTCRPDIQSALLICEALNIPVEQGFRLAGSVIYSPCYEYNAPLVVNLRTLEVVRRTEKNDSDKFERLYFKIQRKKVNADSV